MIQDIFPYRLDHAFRDREPEPEDCFFSFRGGEVLLRVSEDGSRRMDGDFRGHGRMVHVASQTGNGGFCGTVLELVKDIAPLADRVYACGPRQMLQAVAEWAERQGIPAQVSMEERMACGITLMPRWRS